VFGPVWSALCAGIVAVGWRVPGRQSRGTQSPHLAQLALNAAWPIAVFKVRDKRASLVIIALLDGVIAAEVLVLRREDPVAAVLLVPYLSWSGFVTALNAR
jgi:translocator protein